MTIRIDNLPVDVTEEEIKQLLLEDGAVGEIVLKKVAFITLEEQVEDAVVQKLNDQEKFGQILKVSKISDRDDESKKGTQGGGRVDESKKGTQGAKTHDGSRMGTQGGGRVGESKKGPQGG